MPLMGYETGVLVQQMANNQFSEESYRRILAILASEWDDSDGMTLTHVDGGTWVNMSI